MRVLSWNCNLGLNTKIEPILELDPDVAVISECARDARIPGLERVGWTGRNPSKGLAVYARGGGSIDPSHDPSRQWFLPARPENYPPILAIWAMNHRGSEPRPSHGRTISALNSYASFLADVEMVVGDFNDNAKWEKSGLPQAANILRGHGLRSAYHEQTGEPFGEETSPTFRMNRSSTRTHHIDYAFTRGAWAMAILPFDEWRAYSDHSPLLIYKAHGQT